MKKNKVIIFFKDVLLTVIIVGGILFSLKTTIVSGESMNPTLNDGDYLIINKLAYLNKKPERGDIIVFKSNLVDDYGNKKDLLKRVIGLPGERVEIKNNKVYVNNIKLNESYVNNIEKIDNIDITVPKDKIFTMGDNRSNSIDSRHKEVGNISIHNIIGKVSIKLYPLEEITLFKD